MESELRNVKAALGGVTEGRYGDGANATEVVLRQCGIGKVNAAVGTMQLITDYHPDCIISTGLAGGIGDQAEVWDVIVSTQTAYHDVFCGMDCEQGQVLGLPTRFDSYLPMVDFAMTTGAQMAQQEGMQGCQFIKGLICTGDQFITKAEPVRAIQQAFPDVMACDMESAAIAHVCHLMKVPFVSIRVISDTPLRTHDHALQWEESLAMMSDRSFRFIDLLLRSLPKEL